MPRSQADLVLEWCTLQGSGSREQLERAIVGQPGSRRGAILSGLEIAGHVEVDWERTGRWSVNPPVLALPEGSGGNAHWVGGRNEATLDLIEQLERDGAIESFVIVEGVHDRASSWFVGVSSLEQLESAATALGATVAIDPATLLMDTFVDLDQALSARRTDYTPSGFQAKRLDVQSMRYEPVDVKYARWPAGCFEQLSMGRRKYIFVDDDDTRYVCDRWVATHAELRRRRRAGEPVPTAIHWDRRSERLAVLASAQLPTAWTRAAALCSGLAPRRVEHRDWVDIFEGVRARMYGRFCKALEITPHDTDLSSYDQGRA